MTDVKKMVPYVIATVSLAVIDVMGIAVLEGFKDADSTTKVLNNESNWTGAYQPLINSTQIDYFINGLIIFGVFIGIVILALVGKIVVGIFKD